MQQRLQPNQAIQTYGAVGGQKEMESKLIPSAAQMHIPATSFAMQTTLSIVRRDTADCMQAQFTKFIMATNMVVHADYSHPARNAPSPENH